MNGNVCCFFGHRIVANEIRNMLFNEIERLIVDYNVCRFYVGNQGEYDKIVRSVLKEIKKNYEYIQYSVVLAYLDSKNQDDIDYYEETEYPDGLEAVPKRFAISWRNKWMVDRSQFCIAYVTDNFGGAAKFVELARKKKLVVINIAEKNNS